PPPAQDSGTRQSSPRTVSLKRSAPKGDADRCLDCGDPARAVGAVVSFVTLPIKRCALFWILPCRSSSEPSGDQAHECVAVGLESPFVEVPAACCRPGGICPVLALGGHRCRSPRCRLVTLSGHAWSAPIR